jgi:AcrR family transcriptional regulator
MDVFWARGYEGATLEELQTAMGGIAPPSFYAAFGSKDKLFREAVALYHASMGERMRNAMTAPTAREAIEAMLHEGVRCFSESDTPRGCLLILGAINCTRANKEAYDHLHELREQGPEMIRQRLLKGLADGDLPAGTPISEMASFYATVMQGVAVRARDGASRATLDAVANAAMAASDPLVRSGRRAPTAARGTRSSGSGPRPRRRRKERAAG